MADFFSGLRVRLMTPVLVAVAPAWAVMLYNVREEPSRLFWLLAVTVLAFLAAWAAGDVFVLRPVQSLAETAQNLKEGNLSARAGLDGLRGEIGQLAHTLDSMAQALEERTLDLLKANGDLQFEVAERKRAQEAMQRDQAILKEAERRFRETLENVKLLSVGLDPEGIITFCNDLFLRVTGWTREEILGRDWFGLFVETPGEKEAFLDAVRRRSVFPHFENRVKTRDGRTRFVAWSNVVLRDPEGGVAGTVSIGDDVTEQREAARQLMVRNRQLTALFDITSASTQSLELDEVLQRALDAALKALELDAAGVYLMDPGGATMTLRAHRNLSESFRKSIRPAVRIGEGVSGRAVAARAPVVLNVDEHPSEVFAAAMRREHFETAVGTPLLADQEVVGALNFASHRARTFPPQEIEVLATLGQLLGAAVQKARLYERLREELDERTRAEARVRAALAEKESAAASLAVANAELEASRAELHELAIHDELTGLLNRREMNRLLDEEVSRLHRYGNPVALLIMDIDRFKTLNDTYGHGAGDEALRWVAGVLRRTLRAVDRAVRYGGDELVVILPGLTPAQALQMSERFRRAVHSAVFRYPEHAEKGLEIPITLSIGSAGLPGHGTTAEGLLLAADRALYEAKRRGRDQCVSYAELLERRSSEDRRD